MLLIALVRSRCANYPFYYSNGCKSTVKFDAGLTARAARVNAANQTEPPRFTNFCVPLTASCSFTRICFSWPDMVLRYHAGQVVENYIIAFEC